MVGRDAFPNLTNARERLIGVAYPWLDGARIVSGGNENRVRIIRMEGTETNIVGFGGIKFCSSLAQIGGDPIRAVKATEEECMVRADIGVIALGIVVNASCNDGLDCAVGINLHVVIPTAIVRLPGRRDRPISEYFGELGYDRGVLVEYIGVHQGAIGFEALAVLNVAVVHAGAGIAWMGFGADEVDAVNTVVTVFEVAADVANVDVC